MMKTHVNLLSQAFQRRQLFRARMRTWAIVLLGTSGLGVVVGGIAWTELRTVSLSRDWLETQYSPVESLKGEIARFGRRIRSLRQRESAALQLSEDRSVVSLIAIVGQAKEKADDEIYIERFLLDQNPEHSSFAEGDQVRPPHLLTMNGIGLNDLAVARFTAALRDAEVFADVTLKSTVATSVGESRLRTFHMECSF